MLIRAFIDKKEGGQSRKYISKIRLPPVKSIPLRHGVSEWRKACLFVLIESLFASRSHDINVRNKYTQEQWVQTTLSCEGDN